MTSYIVTANAISSEYEAESPLAAIGAYLADAGYSNDEDAAEACGQSVDEFLADIHAEPKAI